MKKISISEAVGEILDYDITGVDPATGTKGRVFKRGHVIEPDDLERLKDLGREHIFIRDGNDDEIHEDDAAILAAPLIAGENIDYDREPVEGKIRFFSRCDGVFRVDVDRLYRINELEVPSLPTLHTNLPVTAGQQVAAFRIIPLTSPRHIIDSLKKILERPLIHCHPYRLRKAAIIVTGNEIHSGRKKDAFTPRLTKKLEAFGVTEISASVLPDDREQLERAITEASAWADIILLTGGTSVDPDDTTKDAMEQAGINFIQRGNPVQPGNNLSIGYLKNKPVACIPAAALTYHATALDIFLPRLLAGIPITKKDIIASAHGGLCHFCERCSWPICPFGKGA